jgi:hypothetical protein
MKTRFGGITVFRILIAILTLTLIQSYQGNGKSASHAQTPCSANSEFRVEYYLGTGLGGSPIISRCENVRLDRKIERNWDEVRLCVSDCPGKGDDPNKGVYRDDDFSVRWTGDFDFDEGIYNFTAMVDDGLRVKLDGSTIIEGWHAQGFNRYQEQHYVSKGRHTVVVEYFEKDQGAIVQVDWKLVASPTSAPPEKPTPPPAPTATRRPTPRPAQETEPMGGGGGCPGAMVMVLVPLGILLKRNRGKGHKDHSR